MCARRTDQTQFIHLWSLMVREMLPEASVLWWTATSMRIHCPYCERCHTHEFTRSLDLRLGYKNCLSRLALCQPFPGLESTFRYRITFPLDITNQALHYEIDKENARYVTTSHVKELEEDEAESRKLQDVPDVTEQLAQNLLDSMHIGKDRRNIFFQDATESLRIHETLILRSESETRRTEKKMSRMIVNFDLLSDHRELKIRTIDEAIWNCIYGETDKLRSYLSTSKEKDILINGSNDRGDTALYLAASEGHEDVVSLLVASSAAVDQRIANKRTPLMEAALWGRAACVRRLLDLGARADLQDSKGRIAVDLANQSQHAQIEREARSGGQYLENRYDADRQRRLITLMLRSAEPAQVSSARTTDRASNSHPYTFHTAADGFHKVLTDRVAWFKVPDTYKTIARLERGFSFPPKDAMSGWKQSDANSTKVGGMSIYDAVQDICQIVGHSLPPDKQRDQEVPGRYNAYHAEKKLVAYLISKHRFTPSDIRNDDIRPLINAQPRVELKEATIYVSRAVCTDCADFISAVERHFNIVIHTINANYDDQARQYVLLHS